MPRKAQWDDPNNIQDYRKRLCSLSGFMKWETNARRANAEDNATGHFWQAGFLREPLNNSARARRILCGRLWLGLGERGDALPVWGRGRSMQ
jgi:hypothetical protein